MVQRLRAVARMYFLLPVLGALLLVLLFVDVFLTVFHASGRAGPITHRQNRLLWAAFRAVGIRGDGLPRERLLAFGGPTLVAMTLLVWVGWLVLGYSLIYFPFMPSFLVSPGTLRTPWVEALYYSMYTGGTLGLGDVVADAEGLRLLTGVQALSGFALFSLSITYLLSVYGELIAARATASGISGYFAEGTAATLRRVETAGSEAFARWSEGITAALLRTIQAQFQYPVLNYFRSPDRSRALPVQIGHLLEVCDALERVERSDALDALASHPSYLALVRALEEHLSAVEEHFLPGDLSTSPEEAAKGTEDRTRMRLLRYMGYPP